MVTGFKTTDASNCQVMLRHVGGCDGIFSLDMRNFVLRPFCRCCKNKTFDEFKTDVSAITNDYELLGIRYNDSDAGNYRLEYHLRHISCNQDFWIPALLFRENVYCRVCEADEKPNAESQKYFDAIRKGFNIEKRLRSTKSGPPARYILRHEGTEDCPGCGKSFETTLPLFKISCNCRKCETVDKRFLQLKRHFEKDFPDFEVLRRGTKESYVIVKHYACGGTFEIRVNNFRRKPKCRLCEEFGNKKDTLEESQAKIDAVSEGYTVLSIDRTNPDSLKYLLKHSGGCGGEFLIESRLFKRSPFCRKCKH